MKTLLLVRHAKSSWKDMSLSDWERPLNKRGKRDAPVMGQRLAKADFDIDSIMSSTAVRAISTADAIAAELLFQKEIDQKDELYHADVNGLLNVIRDISNELDTVMLVAHNPSITDLVNELSGEWIDNVPTCGIAAFKYDINSWKDVGRVAPKNFLFDYPKNK